MKLWHYTVFLVVVIGFVMAFFWVMPKEPYCPIDTICIEIDDYEENNCSLYTAAKCLEYIGTDCSLLDPTCIFCEESNVRVSEGIVGK